MKRIVLAVAALMACCAVSVRADSTVVFNEIMYHPQTNEPVLEWLELHNQMAVDLDLSGWSLANGIEFQFVEGTVIRGGAYLVVAAAPAMLTAATGLTNVLGPFIGRLSNAGEEIELRNNNDRVMDAVNYGVEGDWPVAPDGAGVSLAKRAQNMASGDARNWTASAQIGGTPGAENFPILPPTVIQTVAIGIEGSWRFNDAGANLGTAWRDRNYDDSGWASGAALFFHEDAPLPAAKNTPLTPGRIIYYFRTQFVITGEVSRVQLQLQPLVDDGAVGYLNGVEVFRVNMPAGEVAYDTLANGQVGDATFGQTILLRTEQFLAGTNVLAVEVHQAPRFVAYPQAVLNSAPVGYWRLGETGGTAVDSASAPGTPQSGAQNGTFAGFLGSNLGQPGPRPSDMVNAQSLTGFETGNASPRFAGNLDGGNDVVTIADAGLFNFSGTRTFTLEAWVNGAAAQEDGAAIIAKGAGGGGEQFAIDVVGGNYRFFAWDGGSPNTPAVVTASVGPNNSWQHVAGVLDQPAGRMKIYVNGVERGSGTPRSTLVNTLHEVSIGARKNGGSSNYDLNFDGRIDEVAIYNRALPTNEILAHFNGAFSTNSTGGADTNDVVFGLAVIASELLPEPEPARVAFNELASSTNSAFWLELINYGRTNVDLGGWIIARFGGMTNREYTLPSQMLAPGQLLQVTKTEMGFGADSGDRLVLFHPGRTNVADAVVAKKDPRGRRPDGTGAWWFPDQPTPGASNRFVFHDELVINEIMFHQRELPPEPATFSPTNVLVPITNLWKYHAQGIDLETAWRAPDYDDSGWAASNAVFYAPTNPFTLPAPKNTFVPLTNSSGARIITFYFRTQFTFNGDTNGLMLGLHPIIDDGAVFYLNGVEVYRLNMPTTNILYGTLATVNIGIPVYTPTVTIPTASLVPGLNTLAVEVHQVSAINSDMDFGTELLAWYQLTPALPFRDSPESWVEIFNRHSNIVDLTGWRLDEGIDYRFAPGKTIAPGGYLVMAKDVAYMQALYPSIDIVGPFTNKLSKNSDYIVLKDANNNPADEVRYFDGGRWPEYADGGGSSLELRDPRADNSVPEAWAASNEDTKSSWQTYTYRGVAVTPIVGSPSTWNELDLGLIDGAGEVLLDDISVIENPTNAPVQFIQNGSFNDGTASHWRFVGNHRRSRVEPEPGNPGNHVLHLIASGPTEYQGNQIETTYVPGRSVVDGRTYEISFRAKWLAGANLLNTRLYFTRLARTTRLALPALSGTPGAQNSVSTTHVGPVYSEFRHEPVVPDPGEPVTVTVVAQDPDVVSSLQLYYSVGGGAWSSLVMSNMAGHTFTGVLPGQSAGTLIQFYVEGRDSLGAVSLFPSRGTNSRALLRINDGQAAMAPLHNFRLLMTQADADFMHAQTNVLSNELLDGTVIYDEQEVFYDIGVRLKGSFVGRDVARVGFTVVFHPEQLFRGVHDKVAIDRSQHAVIGQGEIIAKHIASHAGGIPNMYDDLVRFMAPRAQDNSMAQLRLAGFDDLYLDSQFKDGSDGPMYEFEVFRYSSSTSDGTPEGLKLWGPGYVNLDIQDYGDDKESYRWLFLQTNNRTEDEYSRVIAMAKAFSLTGTNLDLASQQWMDVDEWLRVFAYESLLGVGDAYFTGGNHHNLRLYVRPEDQKVLAMPWDWDSAFFNATSAALVGGANLAKIVNLPNNLRAYYTHLHDVITTTYNTAYMSRWTQHYGALAGQDFGGLLNYIGQRASFVMSQLPTTTAFAITSNSGNDFGTSSNLIALTGTAPIQVKTIRVNGISYALTWTTLTNWRLSVPLYAGTNLLVVEGFNSRGVVMSNAIDTITIRNTGTAAPLPVVINEWMADNAGPGGLADPVDGLFQDWFELFNPNTNAFNLGGYFLTDNLSQPTKWRVPTNTFIAARGFLLVWADNQTNQNGLSAAGDLHAPFQLNNGGEEIGLFAPDGMALQSAVAFETQIENVSQGCFPNGDTNSVYFMTNFTPRAANMLGGALRFTEVSVSSNTMTLRWEAVSNHIYRVQYKNNLSDLIWTNLGADTAAMNNFATATDVIGPNPQRFYRVLRVD
jgi:hypothetical protein